MGSQTATRTKTRTKPPKSGPSLEVPAGAHLLTSSRRAQTPDPREKLLSHGQPSSLLRVALESQGRLALNVVKSVLVAMVVVVLGVAVLITRR